MHGAPVAVWEAVPDAVLLSESVAVADREAVAEAVLVKEAV